MRPRIAVLPLAVVALTLPLKYSPTDGVTLARACGQEVPPPPAPAVSSFAPPA
jgi:hypothetical protein